MTEPQTNQQAPAVIETGKPIGGLIPTDFEGLWRFAKILSVSGLMPNGLQKPESIFVAIQMGLEVGLSPMQAVQNIAVINGKPALWGDAVLALVLKSNQVKDFSERFEGDFPNDNFTAICEVERLGFKTIIKRTFSVIDAKNAGLWTYSNNNKSQHSPWAKYPKRMLQMRARSWALRDGFSDYLKGFGVVEEVRDYIDITPKQEIKPQIETKPHLNDHVDATIADSINHIASTQMLKPEKINKPTKKIFNNSFNETFNELCKQHLLNAPPEINQMPTREVIDKLNEYCNLMAIQSDTNTHAFKDAIIEFNGFEDFWTEFIHWIKIKSYPSTNINEKIDTGKDQTKLF